MSWLRGQKMGKVSCVCQDLPRYSSFFPLLVVCAWHRQVGSPIRLFLFSRHQLLDLASSCGKTPPRLQRQGAPTRERWCHHLQVGLRQFFYSQPGSHEPTSRSPPLTAQQHVPLEERLDTPSSFHLHLSAVRALSVSGSFVCGHPHARRQTPGEGRVRGEGEEEEEGRGWPLQSSTKP